MLLRKHHGKDPEKLAIADKKRIIVIFDEFQDAIRVGGDNILKLMRSHFQVQTKANYLFLGSQEGIMNNIFGGPDQAFYRFATVLPLPPIDNSDWIEYISKKFNELKIQNSVESIREIVKVSGGHPQDTMLLCSEIYYIMLSSGEKRLTKDIVEIGAKQAMSRLISIFDGMLEEIGSAKRILFRLVQKKAIYEKGIHPSETKRMVDLLMAKGIIEKTDRGSYVFVEPMLKEYIYSL